MASIFLDRVLNGVPDSEIRSPFDPRTAWIYWITLFELALGALLMLAMHFTISLVAIPWWAVFACFAGMLLRRYGHAATGGALEATGLVYGQGVALLLLLFPLTSISAPFADASLASIDRAVGFDWPAFASLFANRPLAQHALVVAYHSFNWQPLLLVLMLFFSGKSDRGWLFVVAGTIAGLLTALLYPFAPAVGAFYHYHVNPHDFPKILSPWQFAPVLHMLKDQGIRDITPKMFTGLVSFPSYHAAAAVIFVWAARPFRLRWLFVALNVCLCASALIVGAHYLIDVAVGAAVGIVSIYGAQVMTMIPCPPAPGEPVLKDEPPPPPPYVPPAPPM